MRKTLLQVLTLASFALPAHAQAPRHATVTGSVTGATSRRGVDAALIALDNGGSVRTNSRGEFVIKDLPPGTYRVRVSRIGYRPKTLSLPISPEDTGHPIFVDVSLEPLPVELKPVVIRGDTNSVVAYGRLADFYRHRRSEWGQFITRADIDRRRPFRISDMLVGLSGVWFSYNDFGDRVFSFGRRLWSVTDPVAYGAFGEQVPVFYRSWRQIGAPGAGAGCGPAVFLDGVRVPGWIALDDLVSPDQVEGIEVYRGDLTTPFEYSGGCGAIAVWTR